MNDLTKYREDTVAYLSERDARDEFSVPLITADDYINPGLRDRISLNGEWRFTIDPFDAGLRQRWFAMRAEDSPRTGAYDWDPYQAETVHVPSAWNALRPEWRYFEGGAWYSRTIVDPRRNSQERAILHVGGARYAARIFANGVFLGCHLGGSTPFTLDLSDVFVDGKTQLFIHVENDRRNDRAPGRVFDWFNYGGITRNVDLLVLPENHVVDAFFQWNGTAIVYDIQTNGGGSVEIKIPELDHATQVATEGRTQGEIQLDPVLWSTKKPKLYDIQVRFFEDFFPERVGFRTITTQGRDILINGERIVLKGVGVHEDDDRTGCVLTESSLTGRLTDLKDLNANFMRLPHFPQDDRMARACDEAGILLLAEIPVYWMLDYSSPVVLSDTSNQLAELIKRDRNRASVLGWTISNETPDTEARLRFTSTLADLARQLDPSRPVVAACLYDEVTFEVSDSLTEIVDIIGVNEYYGWYDPDFTKAQLIIDNFQVDKPLLITEFGCEIRAGHSGEGAYSEEYGVLFYEKQCEIFRSAPWLAGFSAWVAL